MATKSTNKKSIADTKSRRVKSLTATQAKEELIALQELIEDSSHCIMCNTTKSKDKFYMNTDPMMNGGKSVTPICKECARKIALQVDKYGDEHEPTKESVQKALYYLNKPFLESVWDSSVQEYENLLASRAASNVWVSYIRIIQMSPYVGMTYLDSDVFNKDFAIKERNKTEDDLKDYYKGSDTYEVFQKNKKDVIRLLDFDPFEKEPVADQPFLYSQLIGLLDANGDDGNEDIMRNSSAISIVRGFLQQQKIDDSISRLMSSPSELQHNSATIKSLQESKGKITTVIKDLAAESCISLKNNKNTVKGENTFTGKLKKIKDLDLRDYELNGYDIETCKGMQQVADISMEAILKTLKLDETEYSDMIAEQSRVIKDLQYKADSYEESMRILLKENIELRDYLEKNGLLEDEDLTNLTKLVNHYVKVKNEGSPNA